MLQVGYTSASVFVVSVFLQTDHLYANYTGCDIINPFMIDFWLEIISFSNRLVLQNVNIFLYLKNSYSTILLHNSSFPPSAGLLYDTVAFPSVSRPLVPCSLFPYFYIF